MKKFFKTMLAGTVLVALLFNFNANAQWNVTGNTGTVPGTIAAPGTNFLGTTDLQDFSLRTNNVERLRIGKDGSLNLGAMYPPDPTHITPQLLVQSNAQGQVNLVASFIQNRVGSTLAAPNPLAKVNILDAFPAPGSGFINGSTWNGTSWATSFSIDLNGTTVLGDPALNLSGYRLTVIGGILAEKVKIALHTDATNWSWPDYVFKKDYKLLPLNELESFIKKNKHLPGIPSESEVKKDGLDVVEMDAALLKKIEELTLYLIEIKKENETFRKVLETQNNKIKALELIK
jgi:hypothetical protein